MKWFLGVTFLFCSSCGLMGGGDGVKPETTQNPAPASPPIGNPANAVSEKQPRSRLMVLPFLDSNEVRPQELRDQARSEVIRAFNKKGQVIVVDSQELNLDTKKLKIGGEYNLTEVAKLANQLGVAAVMEGKILDLHVKRMSDQVGLFRQMQSTFECKARVRVVSARSGKELLNLLKTVTIEDKMMRVAETADTDRLVQDNPEIFEKLVVETFLDFEPQIVATVEKLNWEGRIAMISGDRIFLNVGRVSGVQIGDILKVTEAGEEVYDPQTGNYIGRVPGRIKGTLEVISFFGTDGAISVVHSGSGFKENDKIELY